MPTSPLSPGRPLPSTRRVAFGLGPTLAAVSYSIRHSVRSRRPISLQVGAQDSYSYGEPRSSAMHLCARALLPIFAKAG